MIYFNILLDLLQGFIIGIFSYLFIIPKEPSKKYYHIILLSLILGTEILYFDFTTIYESFLSLAYVITLFIYLKFISKSSTTDVFLLAIIVITTTSVGNGFAIFIFSILLNNNLFTLLNSEIMLLIAALISTFTFTVILYLVVKTKKYITSLTSNHGKYFITAMLILFISITLLEEMVFAQSYDETNLLASLMLFLAVFILLLIIMFKNAKDSMNYTNQEMISQELKHMNEKFEVLEASNNEIKIMKHDLNKTLFILKEYIVEGKLEKVNKVIDEMITDIHLTPRALISGISSIDSVITSKALECSKKKIHFTYNIETSYLSCINDFDLSLIFLNSLSNAIENIDSKNRIINLEVTQNSNILYIQVVNKVSIDVFDENPQLISTKSSKNHGYGIKSMRNIARKYNGDIHLFQNNQDFHCIITLQIATA